MRLRSFCYVTLAGLALVSSARAEREASEACLGKKTANLVFKDEAGQAHALYDLKDKKAIVLVFLSFDCPVSISYAQPLADMAKEYGKYGVSFIGLTVNEDDTPAGVAKQARQFNLPFPVYVDRDRRATNALKAETTPECFVLDGAYVLRYRGRIDDSYYERLKKHPRTTRQDLRQVVGELLSGRPVSVAATRAVGCPIARLDKPVTKATNVTYYRDVAPLIQEHCQQCHRPGEVGPFSLMTYKQAVNWSDDIKHYTQTGLMPPWKAVAGPAFHNDRRMSQQDIDTLAAWVDGGAPAGDPKDAPPPRRFTEGWQLGTPDLVLTADADFIVGPTGSDQFRCFVLPTHLSEDKYVAAVEVRPSNPRIVHHTLQYVDTTGTGRSLETAAQSKEKGRGDTHEAGNILDSGPGYTNVMGVGFRPQGGMGGWAPGQMARYLPDNAGYFLPKGADVVMQVHYHRNGRIEKDRTQLGLYFVKAKKAQPWRVTVLPGTSGNPLRPLAFRIPAGNDHYHIQGSMWANSNFTLRTVMPHMHMVGKEVKVTMTPPGGKSTTLVAIKNWDYNWQETYTFKDPIQVTKGTKFHVDAYYDNSSKNPNNPYAPPREITYGEQTFNEMCYIFLGGTGQTKGRQMLTPFPPAVRETASRAVAALKEATKSDAKPLPVPFKLTDTQHIMVRVKINGKGPFNFIVDTGAPIIFVATEVGKKIGLDMPAKGLTTIDKLEFEGGASLRNVKCRVETPFQLEGMNGMGLAGVELHGILGYTVLAKFRMTFDFTKDTLRWTPLNWQPPPPQRINAPRGGQMGLEIIGSLMKFLGPLMGLGPAPPPETRGFLGIELADKDGRVTLDTVLAKSPAAGAGVKAGDRIEQINGHAVKAGADVERLTAKVLAGQTVAFTIQRGTQTVELKITAGEGL